MFNDKVTVLGEHYQIKNSPAIFLPDISFIVCSSRLRPLPSQLLTHSFSPSTLKNLLLINLAMLSISTSGALGRTIAMPPTTTIFWRALLAVLLFAGLAWWQGTSLRINNRRDLGKVLLSGVLMAVHWVTYFYALRLSSVAIGMLSLFTYPVFTAMLEPLLLKTRFQWAHLSLGVLTLVGIYFLVPAFDLANDQFQAIGWGIFSALSYALRNLLLKAPVAHYRSTVLMFYQIGTVALVLAPLLWLNGPGDIAHQWPPLLLLALLTTVVGHTLFLASFRHFSITTASIMSCTQPIFGIILGAIFLQEYPTWGTCLGGALILLAVVLESLRVRR